MGLSAGGSTGTMLPEWWAQSKPRNGSTKMALEETSRGIACAPSHVTTSHGHHAERDAARLYLVTPLCVPYGPGLQTPAPVDDMGAVRGADDPKVVEGPQIAIRLKRSMRGGRLRRPS